MGAFYKAAISRGKIMGVLQRHLQGVAQRGGITTPLRQAKEVSSVMKSKPKLFDKMYPEYKYRGNDVAAKLQKDMAPKATSSAVKKQHTDTVKSLAADPKASLPGGNPNVVHKPYALGASPNLQKAVKRNGGTSPESTPSGRDLIDMPKVRPLQQAGKKQQVSVNPGATPAAPGAKKVTPPPVMIPAQPLSQSTGDARESAGAFQNAVEGQFIQPRGSVVSPQQAAAQAAPAAAEVAQGAKDVGKSEVVPFVERIQASMKENPLKWGLGAAGTAGVGAGLYGAAQQQQNEYQRY